MFLFVNFIERQQGGRKRDRERGRERENMTVTSPGIYSATLASQDGARTS